MNQSQKRQLIYSAAIAMLLAGVYLWLCWMDTHGADERTLLLHEMDAASITGITFSAAGEPPAQIALLRSADGTWYCDGYNDLPLNQTRIENMCQKVAELQAETFVAEGVDAYAQYGLAQPSNTIEVQTAADTLTLYLGDINSATGDCYLRLNGAENIYTVDSTFSNLFTATVYDLASKEAVASIPMGQVSRLVVETTAGSLHFSRDTSSAGGSAWSVTDGTSALGSANTTAIEQLLASIQHLSYDRMVLYHPAQTDLARYGLDSPAATIRIEAQDSDIVLTIGGFDGENTGRYVYAEQSSGIHVIEASQLDELFHLTLEQFQSLDIAPVKQDELIGLSASCNGKTYEFDQRAGQWSLNGTDMEEKAFNAFYYPLYALSADKSVSDLSAQLNDPAVLILKYQRRLESGGDLTVEFLPFDQNYYAVRINDVSCLLISRTKVHNIIASLPQ